MKELSFDEYQGKIEKSDVCTKPADLRENIGQAAFLEKVLGLAGESGEAVDKIKKVMRDKEGRLSDEDRGEIVKELGDVLWYVATIARYIEVPLSEVVRENVKKMESRMKRGVLHGEGDNR